MTFFASDQYGPAIYWDPAKDMRFGKGGAGLYNPYGFVEQMRIQSSTGNVGIGTSNPGSRLDVVGDLNLTGAVRYQGTPVLQLPGGSGNTALGLAAPAKDTSGFSNTAIGFDTLFTNLTGNNNTALGTAALYYNGTGSANTGLGVGALQSNCGGSNNTAVGTAALMNNTMGTHNIAIGAFAALNVDIGNSNNIHIGTVGAVGDSAVSRSENPGRKHRSSLPGFAAPLPAATMLSLFWSIRMAS